MRWLKRLLCRHDFRFHRNIYGDEIILANWNRSDWKCAKCGRLQLRPEFNALAHLEACRASAPTPPDLDHA